MGCIQHSTRVVQVRTAGSRVGNGDGRSHEALTFRRLKVGLDALCEGTGSEHRTCSEDTEGCADPGGPGLVLIPANGPVLVGAADSAGNAGTGDDTCANRGIPCNSRLRHPASCPFGCRAERTPNSIEWVVHFVSITGEGSRPLGPGNGGPPKWRRSSHRKPAYAGVGQSPVSV